MPKTDRRTNRAEKIPRLTNEEKETLISFDETPAPANIFTYNKRWQKHLEIRLGLKPIRTDEFGGKEYSLPKSRISMPRVPKKLSDEQRQKAGERLRQARSKKSPG